MSCRQPGAESAECGVDMTPLRMLELAQQRQRRSPARVVDVTRSV